MPEGNGIAYRHREWRTVLSPLSVSMASIVLGPEGTRRALAYVSSVMAIMFICGCGLPAIDGRGDAAGMQPGEPRFEYRGISINYEDQGQGQPLILLHGYGASTYSWRYIAPYFSKSYRVIAIDLKGFGLSDKPIDDDYSVRDQSRIISEFIRVHRLENVILAGKVWEVRFPA